MTVDFYIGIFNFISRVKVAKIPIIAYHYFFAPNIASIFTATVNSILETPADKITFVYAKKGQFLHVTQKIHTISLEILYLS